MQHRVEAVAAQQTEHLARIHDVLGIERPLDRAHDVELGPGAIVLELVELLDADAVFRRDRAAHGGDEVVDGPCDRRGILGQRIEVHALRAHEGEVHIAVSDVAERIGADRRQDGEHGLETAVDKLGIGDRDDTS